MSQWFDRLLTIDFGELWTFLGDVLRNPTSNLLAFVLILGGITIVMLLVITVLLIFFAGADDEEEYDDEGEELDGGSGGSESSSQDDLQEPSAAAAPLAPDASAVPATLTSVSAITGAEPESAPAHERRRLSRTAGTALWLLIIAVVWVIGGVVSSSNTMCVSCHLDDSIHTARIDGAGIDPHDPVACVSCHEGTDRLARVTVAVPGRAIHFVAGMVLQRQADGYGLPVRNNTCLDCHDDGIEGTVHNETRGVKMSHAEPLEAGALCGDCHEPQAGTGIINRYTVGMEPCLRCHDAQQASAACDYCHTKDIAYAMKVRTTTEPRDHVATLDCGGCHSLETCDACHGTRLPHSQVFLAGGHAREAVEDIWFNGGEVCDRCHTSTRRSCTNCHWAGDFPQHALNFATDHQSTPPNNNGCDGCHGHLAWDANRNFCALCHDRYGLGFENVGGLE